MQATNTGVRRPGYEATPSVPSQPHLPVLFIATSAPQYLTLVTVLDLFIATCVPRYLTLVTVLDLFIATCVPRYLTLVTVLDLFIATCVPRYLTLITVLDLFIATSAPRYLTLVTVLEYSSRQVDQRLHDNNIRDVIIVHVTSPDAQTNQNTKQF